MSDIPLLVHSFLQRGDSGQPRLVVDPVAMARLQAHAWPGNIRELRNVLERTRLFADDGVVCVEHLPAMLGAMPMPPSPGAAPPPAQGVGRRGDVEDATIRQLLATTRGTRKELTRQLGLSERTLYRRLKALGLA